MRQTSFHSLPCPVARALDRVGEWWSILILRDACRGKTRFDEFQKSLGVAPNILACRLRGLVEAGLLEKVRYTERPPRDAYVLTAVGADFLPVLQALSAWGNRHFALEQQSPASTGSGARAPGAWVVNDDNGAPVGQAALSLAGCGPAAQDPIARDSADRPRLNRESRRQS